MAPGRCDFPKFEIYEKKYPGKRYVYIDEIQNNIIFAGLVKLFILFENLDSDVLVMNGKINPSGDAELQC